MTQIEQVQKWRDTADLRAFARKWYSQNGEDGMIEEILRRIGVPKDGYFVEFGANDGSETNCGYLAFYKRWGGLFIEPLAEPFETLKKNFEKFPAVRCVKSMVTPENIEAVFEEAYVPKTLDLLSIDIDGEDYWVWKALEKWRPKVVVIEYNAAYPPPRLWVLKRDPNRTGWNGTTDQGASLSSLAKLGRSKGYELVATDPNGVNAFFVLKELVTFDKFTDPAAIYFYQPLTYGPMGAGHPQGVAEHEEI